MHLGVDPGHDGAAVLVAASGVRAWRWYDRRGRKTSPGYDLAEGGVELLHGVSLARIGHTVGVASVGAALVVEGLFVGANGDAALDPGRAGVILIVPQRPTVPGFGPALGLGLRPHGVRALAPADLAPEGGREMLSRRASGAGAASLYRGDEPRTPYLQALRGAP